jgi:putative thiamine transport system permease protein
MLRLVPLAALALLIGPVAAGLLGALLPAFGYMPGLGGTRLTTEPFGALAAMPGITRSALLSLATGLASTALSFAIVILFVAAWRGTRLFRAMERIVSPLLSIPHAAAAFGLAFLIAPSGLLMRAVSPWATGFEQPPDLLIVHDRLALAMVAGLVAKEVPFLFLMILAALLQARASARAEVAVSIGYGRVAGFALAVLPVLYRQLRLPVLAVLAYATSVVDVAMILGPTLPAPLAVRVLGWQHDPDLSLRFVAAAGAVLQLGVTLTAIAIWLAGERMLGRVGRSLAASGRRFAADKALRLATACLTAVSALAILAGLAALALASFAGPWRFPDALPATFSLSVWRRLLPGLGQPIANALVIGGIASLATVALALGALEHETRSGRSRAVQALVSLYVPLLVPQIAFLFGLTFLFAAVRLDGTLAAVVLVHMVFVFPYVLLSLAEPWRSFDMRLAHAARALGHGANAVFWRVRLPILTRPVLTAWAVGFAVSIGLYLPTLLIGAGRVPTVTTEALALASGGDRRLIGATALVQAMLPFIGFALALAVPAILFRGRRRMRAAR